MLIASPALSSGYPGFPASSKFAWHVVPSPTRATMMRAWRLRRALGYLKTVDQLLSWDKKGRRSDITPSGFGKVNSEFIGGEGSIWAVFRPFLQ